MQSGQSSGPRSGKIPFKFLSNFDIRIWTIGGSFQGYNKPPVTMERPAQRLLACQEGRSCLELVGFRTTILPVVLHGCETWSLTLREECRLRVYEYRALRRIFGPKRDEVTSQ